MERVGGEIEVAHLFFVAVAVGVSAFFGEAVAVAQIAVGILVGEVERLDLCLIEGEQLAFLADAILVEVAPDAQVGKGAIGGIYFAIAVIIKIGQCLIAIGGTFAVFEQGVIAEKLAAVIDDAIAIAVINEETIILADPAGSETDAVFVVIKERAFMTVAGNGFDAVAVQVESEGVKDKIIAITIKGIPVNILVVIPFRINRG